MLGAIIHGNEGNIWSGSKMKRKSFQNKELYKDIPHRGTAGAKVLSYQVNKDSKFRGVQSWRKEATHEAEKLE